MISFNKTTTSKCGVTNNEIVSTVARKMTSDIAPSIINNAYFKPSYRTPYYSIESSISDSILDDIFYGSCYSDGTECPKPESNSTKINLMVGKTKYVPVSIYVTYLKKPTKVYLEEDDLYGEDRTKEMEFPDYACYEIINEFVKLLLENTADPRLSTNVPINQSIIGEISAE